MTNPAVRRLSAFHIFEGLQEGLSRYSGASRVAIIYVVRPEESIHVHDPQNLLRGHEPKLKELYLDSSDWMAENNGSKATGGFGRLTPVENLQLAGLISFGGKSDTLFYQMWFTEHHPDICSTGPTERWLEHAAWLLSKDIAAEDKYYTGTSGYVLREYATHAVRDFIIDELNVRIGMDIELRIYPILDAVLGISKTTEEGAWPRGELVFIEPSAAHHLNFMTSFPPGERPNIQNFKHARKLLQAVEYSDRKLVSDGRTVIGITSGVDLPDARVVADFRGRHGFLKLNQDPVCSFYDGSFHSSTRQAKLVQLEEILLDSTIEPESEIYKLFKAVCGIVHSAEGKKYGCTI
ncbi:MAG: DNA-binding protein, partial [Deltaproteobacteria bacterium]|nr:DNA-binding protein [Deltaproteobacteria bacterium]